MLKSFFFLQEKILILLRIFKFQILERFFANL